MQYWVRTEKLWNSKTQIKKRCLRRSLVRLRSQDRDIMEPFCYRNWHFIWPQGSDSGSVLFVVERLGSGEHSRLRLRLRLVNYGLSFGWVVRPAFVNSFIAKILWKELSKGLFLSDFCKVSRCLSAARHSNGILNDSIYSIHCIHSGSDTTVSENISIQTWMGPPDSDYCITANPNSVERKALPGPQPYVSPTDESVTELVELRRYQCATTENLWKHAWNTGSPSSHKWILMSDSDSE